MERLIRQMLIELGEDPNRQGLLKTPERVAESMQFLTQGYRRDVAVEFGDAVFDSENREMVLVRDIDFFSMCEHHMLPFFGRTHIAYIPDGRIVGLSKLARLVDVYARRLQVQENLTTQIAYALQEFLNPKGVGVVVKAQHLCMMMRGVERQNSVTVTSEMIGEFHDDPSTRSEFLSLVNV